MVYSYTVLYIFTYKIYKEPSILSFTSDKLVLICVIIVVFKLTVIKCVVTTYHSLWKKLAHFISERINWEKTTLLNWKQESIASHTGGSLIIHFLNPSHWLVVH